MNFKKIHYFLGVTLLLGSPFSAGFGNPDLKVWNTVREHSISVELVCADGSKVKLEKIEPNGIAQNVLVNHPSSCTVLQGLKAEKLADPPSRPSPHFLGKPLIQCDNLGSQQEMALDPAQENNILLSLDEKGNFQCLLTTGN
jgi:hypothetical protein